MLSAVKAQLAIDANCEKADFDKSNNSVKILCHNRLKRRNINSDYLFFMACFGKAAVAAVAQELESFMVNYMENREGFRCFDMPLHIMENELKKYGGVISEIEEFYLLNENRICQVTPAFDVEILEGDAIKTVWRPSVSYGVELLAR